MRSRDVAEKLVSTEIRWGVRLMSPGTTTSRKGGWANASPPLHLISQVPGRSSKTRSAASYWAAVGRPRRYFLLWMQ